MLWLLAQTPTRETTPLEQLDPPTRAVVLMALFALVLTGLAMIGLTMIGARWVRRELRDRKPPHNWSRLRDQEPPSHEPTAQSPTGPLGETLAQARGESETRSDNR